MVSALLIGLNRKSISFPSIKVGIGKHIADDVKRQIKAIGLFGIDSETDVIFLGQKGKLLETRGQLGDNPFVIGKIIARMNGRQLNRDARTVDRAAALGNTANIVNGIFVCLVIAIRVFHRAGSLAQHVIGIAIAFFFVRLGAHGCFVNRAAHHELAAHNAHGMVECLPDNWLTGPSNHAFEQPARIGFFRLTKFDDLPGQHQTPGRGINKETVRMAKVALPVGIKQFVLNKFVSSNRIGNTQQGLGKAHQNDAFLARQLILVKQRINPAFAIIGLTDTCNQLIGAVLNAGGLLGRQPGCLYQAGDGFFLVGAIGVANFSTNIVWLGQFCTKHFVFFLPAVHLQPVRR